MMFGLHFYTVLLTVSLCVIHSSQAKDCQDGRFGVNCTEICRCKNPYPCNKITGACYCIVNEVVPEHGHVDRYSGATVSYYCDHGYQLVGQPSHTCLGDGTWNRPAPLCAKKNVQCPVNTDSKGTVWTETQPGSVQIKPCTDQFSGNITRRCKADGTWYLPRYNCVRKEVQQFQNQIDSLATNITHESILEALQAMALLTEDKSSTGVIGTAALTDGELSTLSYTLDTVANVMMKSDVKPTANITNHFLDSVNNLIDTNTHDDWHSINEAGDPGAVNILSAVDTFAGYLGKALNSSEEKSRSIVKQNIALEVKVVTHSDIVFPDISVKQDTSVDDSWIQTSASSIRLQPAALTNTDIKYVTTAVMYKDISDILPTTTDDTDYSQSTASGKDTRIRTLNGPVLSLSLSPTVHHTLNPPVEITFQHRDTNSEKPMCCFLKYDSLKNGYWSSVGCKVWSTNATVTVCKCNHLTNFAVLMSPFKEADVDSFALDMISTLCMAISILCLLITCVIHVWLWKYLKKGRTHLLMHLCGALITSYLLFIAGVDRVDNKTVCTIIAAMLHYIFLVVFCIMLAEGIEIAITILYVFQTRRSVTKWLLFGAWGLPAVIVGITMGVTKLDGFGNNRYCWLSIDDGVIWAFVGPALTIIVFNIVCICLVIRALCFTRSMEMKERSEKVMTCLRSLCVLVPVTGVSWILGIFYIDNNATFMQYVFAICNGLQGLFVFIFHCILNPQVKVSFLKRTKRYSVTHLSKSTTKNQTYTDRISKEKNELHNVNHNGDSSSYITQSTDYHL